jgi:hypothetical protein
MSLDFSTATQADLLAAVGAINPGASLVDEAAEDEMTGTILAAFGGTCSGTWDDSGNGADGTFTGT